MKEVTQAVETWELISRFFSHPWFRNSEAHYADCARRYPDAIGQETVDIPDAQIVRFWSNVDIRADEDCWPWLRVLHQGGYGNAQYTGSMETCGGLAHRAAWIISRSRVLPRGKQMHVRHTCDNPPCCNPRHLTLGTAEENMQDREVKGRGNRGRRIKVRGRSHGSGAACYKNPMYRTNGVTCEACRAYWREKSRKRAGQRG